MSQTFSHLDFMNRIIAVIKDATGLETTYGNSNDKRPPFPYFAIVPFNSHQSATIDVVENELFFTGVQIESHAQSPYEAQDNLEAVRKAIYRPDVLIEFSKANMRPYKLDSVVDNTSSGEPNPRLQFSVYSDLHRSRRLHGCRSI
ncbi:MAG: hypothetical protein DUD35_05380 [Lactobacillus sp.]|nr:MAG: hypothetical protein DUD35_05380 [Lactobacillus sp.]